MQTLHIFDLEKCCRRIPGHLKDILKTASPGSVFIAGGFIRSCVLEEEVNDIDVFTDSVERSAAVAQLYASKFTPPAKVITTKNAFTILRKKPVVQVIQRWNFSKPEDVLASFDFVLSCACIWYDGQNFVSAVHDQYYRDLAGKCLTYLAPIRMEDPGGSMVRVLKYIRRGCTIDPVNLGLVMARVAAAAEEGLDEEEQKSFSNIMRDGVIEGDWAPVGLTLPNTKKEKRERK